MRQIFRIFFLAEGSRPWIVLPCLLLASILEAVGIGSLLPALGAIMDSGTSTAEGSRFEAAYRSATEAIGLVPDVTTLLVIAVSLLVLRSAILFATQSYVGLVAARVSNTLRKKLFSSVFQARWSFYAGQNNGQLAAHISSDTSRAGEAYALSAVTITYALHTAAFTAVALLINWPVALVGIAAGLLIITLFSRLITVARRAGYKATDRTHSMTSEMMDMLHNIKALKTMNRHEAFVSQLERISNRVRNATVSQQQARLGLNFGMEAAITVCTGVLALFALQYSQAGPAELLVVGILFLKIATSGSRLMRQIQSSVIAESAFARVAQSIRTAEQNAEAKGGTAVPSLGAGVVLRDISFAHGPKAVLQEVSVVFGSGQISVLQGPSGTGKTTIIDLVAGLHQPQTGDVLIGSDRLVEVDLRAWRSKLGYVPQELALFHDTVRENITLGDAAITDEQITEAMRLAGAETLLTQLPDGLNTDVGEHGGKLSGGQKQRIAIARALVRKPEVLILDEVTSALDPETERDIVANIGALRGQFTIIAITHRPAWSAIADRLYAVENGRVTLLDKQSNGKAA